MTDKTKYVCEYQLYPDFDWSIYGPVSNWTNALEHFARHVSQYPTEAVRIRAVEMSEEFSHEFIPADFEQKEL